MPDASHWTALDLRDAAALLRLGDRHRVVREVEAHIDHVRPDVRAARQDLLAASDPGSA